MKVEETIDVSQIQKVFGKIKDEDFGSEESLISEKAKKDFQTDKENLTKFINKFTTCSLKDPSCKNIVEDVNQHNHTRSCKKYGPKCRFGFPRFPCIRTEIGIPSDVKFDDPEKASEMLVHAHKILREVKNVLENEEVMETLVKTRQEEIDIYLYHKGIYQKISNHLEEIDRKSAVN